MTSEFSLGDDLLNWIVYPPLILRNLKSWRERASSIVSTKNKTFLPKKGTIVTTPFCPNLLARARPTSTQLSQSAVHSHTTALAHLPTGTRPPLLDPSSLITFVKDRYKGPTYLWINLSSLHCLPFSYKF